MILSLVLAKLIQSPLVLEYPDPKSSFVSVQAIVKLPELTPKERSVAALLARTVAYDVDDYSRFYMRDTTAAAGDQVKVILMPDEMRIQIGVLPEDVKPGLRFLNNILRRSHLPEDELNRQISEDSARKKGLWETAVEPWGSDLRRVRRSDVVDFYHRICRPDNTTIVVGGKVTPGEPQEIWSQIASDWKAERIPRWLLEPGDAAPIRRVDGSENVIELYGEEFPGGDVAIASKLLSIIALGSGKGSVLFEKVREEMGLSYRQEAILWPTPKGFRPRFIIASGDPRPLPELVDAVRKQMLSSIEAWTEDDKVRAIGMSHAIIDLGCPMSPFYFHPYYPLGDNLHDQTFLRAYWRLKTGREWDADHLMDQMSKVSLQDMKDTAKQMIEKASASFIKADG